MFPELTIPRNVYFNATVAKVAKKGKCWYIEALMDEFKGQNKLPRIHIYCNFCV